MASSLCAKNKIQVKYEKSFMITSPYFFPPRLAVLVDPNKSIWTNSQDLEVEIIFFDLKELLVYFSNWHASYIYIF